MCATTDPNGRSFLPVPPQSDFPLQNLPYGVFVPRPGNEARVGVAIGDWILDLSVLEERGLFSGPELSGQIVFARPTLNAFIELGPPAWREARARINRLLQHDEPTLREDAALRERALVEAGAAEMRLPCAIGDYTDFYASRQHAANVGRIFRGPDAALPPNYLHMPIGYHGRASSIVVSGTGIRRPQGQYRVAGRETPEFGPTRELDFELEVGLMIGCGNALGRPIPMSDAAGHIFGLVLVNDWSARDIQQWEYTPLGPFLGKNFGTTISPWVVPLAALEPFRCAGPPQDPEPLPYLRTSGPQSFDIRLQVELQTASLTAPQVISRTNLREAYWTPPQMLVHHTVGGCNLRPGDLLASGTISGDTPESSGSLLELTWRGQRPLKLRSGEQRGFLADGDTVILRGWCDGDGYRVGFGACRGTILPGGSQAGGIGRG